MLSEVEVKIPCGYLFEVIGDGDGPGDPWLPLDGRRVPVEEYPELAALAALGFMHIEAAAIVAGAKWVILPDATPRRIYIKGRSDG